MPGLIFRKRRLLLGGDEFMLPYASVAIGRTVWVLVLVVGVCITARFMLNGVCAGAGYTAFAYEVVSIIVGAVSIATELRIAVVSTYGTIIDPGPREKPMARALGYKSFLGALQLCLGVVGLCLVLYVPMTSTCGHHAFGTVATITVALVATMISQFVDAGGMYCCFLSFTTTESWNSEEVGVVHGVLSDMERKYEEFCRTMCKWLACCTCAFNVFGGGAEETDFAHVSRVFGRLLSARHFMDLVATDIAAGLILLRHVQKAEDYKRRAELLVTTKSTITADPGKIESSREAPPGSSDDAKVAAVAKDLSAGIGMRKPGEESNEEESTARAAEGKESEGGTSGSAGSHDEAGSRDGQGSRPERGIYRGDSLLAVESPGSVPLEERVRKHRKYYKVAENEKLVDLSNAEDRHRLEELGHFVRYSDVMYSVWGTLVVHPMSGVRRFIRRRNWCPKFVKRKARTRPSTYAGGPTGSRAATVGERPESRTFDLGDAPGAERRRADDVRESLYASTTGHKVETRGDNCWGTHETALRTELPDGAELVLAHFNNCLNETPYCVVVDHVWQSVVISIRGTHSFEDFLVDAMVEPRSMETVGQQWGFDGSRMAAHEGMLRRAQWIRRDLDESGILRTLLGEGRHDRWTLGPSPGKDKREEERRVPLAAAAGGHFCAGYTVRIVGHSLGGGCAALLTLLLKPAYPSARGIAISPPGGLISEGAGREATEAVVTSLVLNDDVIPRMSWQSIEMLADEVLNVLGRSRVSKLFVMRSLLRTEEEAHCPDLYMASEREDISATVVEEGESVYNREVRGSSPSREQGTQDEDTPVGDDDAREDQRRPGGVGGDRVRLEDAQMGSSGGVGGTERFHQQLRRYREHLREQVPSRHHLRRLRLPGRILHLVNTEVVVNDVDEDLDHYGGFCSPCCTGNMGYDRWDGEGSNGPCCCCLCCGRPNLEPLAVSGGGERSRSDTTATMGEDRRSARLSVRGVRHSLGPRRDTSRDEKQKRRRIFTPVWSSPDDLAEIRVTPAFLVDHNPEEILPAMAQTLEDLGVFE